eukprot:m.601901 g.601901  ORF g.601901 m.601901 type:complete len:182 (+) comp58091_c0_seq22:621-1166(+)
MPSFSCQLVFSDMDRNNDDVLSRQELRRGLLKIGCPCDDEFLDEVLTHFDGNHDNVISLQEFMAACKIERPARDRRGTMPASLVLPPIAEAKATGKPMLTQNQISALRTDIARQQALIRRKNARAEYKATFETFDSLKVHDIKSETSKAVFEDALLSYSRSSGAVKRALKTLKTQAHESHV